MKIYKNIKGLTIASLVATLLGAPACTDLESEIFDQADATVYPATENELLSTVGATYGRLRGYYDPVTVLNEATSDEMVVPTRGPDWFDNASWQQMARHEWTPISPGQINGSWEWAYGVIANANINLQSLKESTLQISGKETIVAEVRLLRAFAYFILMDMYGGVPINTEDSPPGNIPQNTRQEVFDFVVKEITESLPDLKDAKDVSVYGRFTKGGANTLLGKVYLNAQVYTGTPKYAEALAALNAVTSSTAGYSLNPNFLENFSVNNGSTPTTYDENILAVPYDKILATGMNWQMRTLNSALKARYGMTPTPWNGFATRAEFYNSYSNDDVRRSIWLVGPQLDAAGNVLTFKDAVDNVDKQLIITPSITSLEKAFGNEGARNVKYEVQRNNTRSDQDNDFVIFRYADVLLMKAEVLMQTGDIAGALEAVNQVRERAKVAPLTTLTMDELLAERGRELAWEGWRRNDLIRFGKWENSWEFKNNSDVNRRLFPIPSQQLSNNPLLKQNPGY